MIRALLVALLTIGCGGSQPPPPASAPPPAPVASAAPAAAPEPDDGRCTEKNLAPLRAAIERTCDVRPEYRDDCLALYKPLPLFDFDASRASDREYCRLDQPDASTTILHHRKRDPKCVDYTVTFIAVDAAWKMKSTDVDKTCK